MVMAIGLCACGGQGTGIFSSKTMAEIISEKMDLQDLKFYTNLDSIDLARQSKITDVSVLSDMSKLEYVDLSLTGVTADLTHCGYFRDCNMAGIKAD